jgi:hypothetical protein
MAISARHQIPRITFLLAFAGAVGGIGACGGGRDAADTDSLPPSTALPGAAPAADAASRQAAQDTARRDTLRRDTLRDTLRR